MHIRTLAGPLLAVASTLLVLLQPASAGAGAPPAVLTIGPDDDLAAALESLRPTGPSALRLEPGTYDVFDRNVVAASGTAQQRIRVAAADPSRPPVIRGSLVLQNPSYWTFDGLVVEGARTPFEAMRINGGTGWVVTRSEFRGRKGYTAQALLNVADHRGSAPRDFRIVYSCFHDGPTAPPSVHDHAVYITSAAEPSVSYVSRNIFYGNRNGSAVKTNSSNIRITYNTMHDVAGAVTVQQHGDSRRAIRGVTTERNLVQTVRTLPGTSERRVFWASYLSDLPASRPQWLLRANYAFSRQVPTYLHRVRSAPRTVRQVGGTLQTDVGDPRFDRRRTCDGYRPALKDAQRYGRWADGGVALLPPR